MISNENEYWYLKGIEDLKEYMIDMTPKDQKGAIRGSFEAVTNLLKRNFVLLKELNKKNEQ